MVSVTTGTIDPQVGAPKITVSDSISNMKRQNLVTQFSFTVTQMATKDTDRASTGNASRSAALALTGQFSLGLSDDDFGALGAEYDILLEATDTLEDIAEKVNAKRETTRVSAQIIKQGSTFYLQFQADDSGKAFQIDKTLVVGDDTLLPDQNYSDAPTLATLIDTLVAKFTFDGTADTRETNVIDDIVEGLTLELTGETNQTYTIDLENDVEGASKIIANYVETHNALVKFLDEKTAIDLETREPLEGATLAKNKFAKDLKLTLLRMASFLSQGTVHASYQSAPSVGLSMDQNNKGQIIYSDTLFKTAFKTEPTGVRQLFTFQSKFVDPITPTTVDENVRLLRAPNRWVTHNDLAGGDEHMLVTINKVSDTSFSATFDVNGTTVNANVTILSSSLRITALGATDFGTDDAPTDADILFKKVLEGLSLSYDVDPTLIATGDTTFRMNGTMGAIDVFGRSVADIFSNDFGPEVGKVFTEQTELTSKKDLLKVKIKKINAAADKKQKVFEKKLAKLQSNLSATLQQLTRLDALFESMKVKS